MLFKAITKNHNNNNLYSARLKLNSCTFYELQSTSCYLEAIAVEAGRVSLAYLVVR